MAATLRPASRAVIEASTELGSVLALNVTGQGSTNNGGQHGSGAKRRGP